jgi:hypothetical protein
MNVVVVVEVVEIVKASPVTSKLKGVDGDVRGIIERNSRIASTIRTVSHEIVSISISAPSR